MALPDDVVGMEGERMHLRGVDRSGVYECDVHWSLRAVRDDALCGDCQYAFDVAFRMDDASSMREGYACADVWGDDARQIGLVADYFGYGPVVVGIVPNEGMTYMLGEAEVSATGLAWRYGYRDVSSHYEAGIYYTWYYRVEATWE